MDERVALIRAQSEANRYLSEIEPNAPILVKLYRQILAQRLELGLHKRNDWLCEIAPFLFRAFSRTVAIELAVLHLNAHSGLYSGSEAEQRASFGSLWAGLEKTYPAELSVVEFGIYEALAEPERSAFRICRDLARLDPGLSFYLGCDHLAERLAPPGNLNGWRLLRSFTMLRILELVTKGSRRIKGMRAPATVYRWALPSPDSNAAPSAHGCSNCSSSVFDRGIQQTVAQ